MLPLRDDNPTRRSAAVTGLLIAASVWVFLAIQPREPAQSAEFLYRRAAIACEVVTAEPLTFPEIRSGVCDPSPAPGVFPDKSIPLSLLTSLFLHAGFAHLAGNMWILWIFGNNIEDRLGHVLYLVFYLVGGLLATACHWAYDPASLMPVIGASGAVSTILGGYAVTWPRARVTTLVFLGFFITTIEVPALIWLGLWLGGQLLDAGFNRDLGVAVWAHIGGFVIGAAAMPLLSFGLQPPGERPQDEFERLLSFPRQDEFR